MLSFLVLFFTACTPHAGQTIEALPQHAVAPEPLPPAVERPRNVVLVIGDGMGLAQVHLAWTANGGSLHLDRLPVVGLARTHPAGGWVTDSAAAATAMATGHKTANKHVGVAPDGPPLTTLVELAEQEGLATGVIATSSLTHATPASFVAHHPDRYDDEAIATFFPEAGLEVAVGGGRQYFADRSDGQDLLATWAETGTTLVDDLDTFVATPSTPVAALLADQHLDRAGERPDDLLASAVSHALELLDEEPEGFFLLVEGSQIDWAGHWNDAERLAAEVLDLDRAVGGILDFAARDGETLVVVTADHETGGLAIMDGDPEAGTVTGRFLSHHHTGEPVPVYAYGPGAGTFTGSYDNTGIFDRIIAAWASVAPPTDRTGTPEAEPPLAR